MARPKSVTPPKYRVHKPSGQGVVRLNGQDIYLGPYNTEEGLNAYDRAISEWMAGGRRPIPRKTQGAAGLAVVELIDAYRGHAERYYRDRDGGPGKELAHIDRVTAVVRRLYGRTPVIEFGPLALKAVRERILAGDLTRKYVNQQIERVVRMFRWGVENQLVGAVTLQALEAVPGLRRGKCGVREGEKVRPVADAHVDAIRPYVSRQVWACVELMRITGMRAGEVLIMRTIDIDRSGEIWEYRPAYHKTDHRDNERIVQLGPKAQEVVEPFLRPDLQAYLFSPADAYRERMEAKREARIKAYRAKHPRARGNGIQPSQEDRSKATPQRSPRDRYDVCSLRRAICRACDLAEAAAKAQLRKQGRKVPEGRIVEQWHPHQLRHTAGTRLRRQYGIEVARVILGHRSPAVTEIYAEADKKRALQVAAEVG